MTRRQLMTAVPALAAARSLLADGANSRIGLCTFSCHQRWKAGQFPDPLSFARYAMEMGAEGVQTSLRGQTMELARQLRVITEAGYYEGDVRLPRTQDGVAEFEAEVKLALAAGARVARAVFTSQRRYETFDTLEAFRAFHNQAVQSLQWAEPVLHRHRLKLAMENHKDFTSEELAAIMRQINSEWIGVLVDTGNNIALLEDPQAVIEHLAPFALSVHLKDMAVQPDAEGFLLSEVPLGTGALDLPKIVTTLRQPNPAIVFNLEMATRDPLRVPCLTGRYFATFPERRADRLTPTLEWVKAHPPRQAVPSVTGKPVEQILAEEEAHNRQGLNWMRERIQG